MIIKEAIHRNRDENSFTSRLFEGSIIPLISDNPDELRRFVKLLHDSSVRCKRILAPDMHNKSLSHLNLEQELSYVDSMIFLEATDWYAAYGKSAPDRTEFDEVIILQSKNQFILLVFEVKCFQTIDIKELKRQQHIIFELKDMIERNGERIIFHHILLIAEQLLNSKKGNLLHNMNLELPVSITSWKDLEPYIPNQRIPTSDLKNFKTISKEKNRNQWSLIEKL